MDNYVKTDMHLIYSFVWNKFVFWKDIFYAHQGIIYLIKNAELCEIILQFKITTF